MRQLRLFSKESSASGVRMFVLVAKYIRMRFPTWSRFQLRRHVHSYLSEFQSTL